MALSLSGKALHFVFKVGDREATIRFYTKILGMKILRHEEFNKGCEATCNGRYDGKWSKTMIGYGPEINHFVIELTYNYGIRSYELGNDFLGITIRNPEAIKKAKAEKYPMEKLENTYLMKAPGGYNYYVIDAPEKQMDPKDKPDPIEKITLASSNLEDTITYWNKILGLKIIEKEEKVVSFAFDEKQCILEFQDIGVPIDHAKAYGRIAFSVPRNSLEKIQAKIEAEKQTVLIGLTSVFTPGKVTVQVVILADPDNHEVCFVDEESFRVLSEIDPKAEHNLTKSIKNDKSSSGRGIVETKK